MSDQRQVPGGMGDRRKIRIAFVIDRLFLPAGGTERQLVHLFEGLDRSRFTPHVICLQPTDWIRSHLDSFAYHVLNLKLQKRPATLGGVKRLARILRDQRVDIVQTHFRDANLVGVTAGAWAGVPRIVSTRRGVPYWSTRIGHGVLRVVNRRVTHFLANSKATAERLIEREHVDRRQVEVIYNGVDLAQFEPRDRASLELERAKLGIAPGAQLVGIVANLRAVKGIDVLLAAAAGVLAKEPTCHFVIVGEGEEEPRLRALARSLGIEDSVDFLGARADVPQLLQLFDVGVLASHFESFSNSILEYLASDLPVVVTDVGGASEVVIPGENGFLVPPGDPGPMAQRLLELLAHPGGARRWRKTRGIAPGFGLDQMVTAHEHYYARVMGAAE